MAHEVNTQFKFEEINTDLNQVTIRFINPHGAIELGEKTLDDFIVNHEVPTGDLDLDGNPITTTVVQVVNENPNDDVIWNYNMPLNQDGTVYNRDQLIQWAAQNYPEDIFQEYLLRKNNPMPEDVLSLANTEHAVTIVYEGASTLGEDSI